MSTKKLQKKKLRKPSGATNHQAGSSDKTGNRSRQGKSSKLNSGKKSTNSKDLDKRLKIPPENEPFVWLMLARGSSLQATADAYTEHFGIEISKSGIQKHRDSHREAYDAFREAWYADIKAEPIANSRVRIVELWNMAVALRKRVIEILDMAPRWWKDLNVASLIAQFVNLIDQIREESGDKTKMGDVPTQPIQNYFGDVTINAFADQAVEARRKETPDSGNRLKTFRLSDSGNPLSNN